MEVNMVNTNFECFTDDGKVIFFLGLSEIALLVLSQKEDQKIALKVIDKCWAWLTYKENIGDILYNLLDDEENGLTIIEEMSDNKLDKIVWNCIIDSVAYTSRKAFEREGVKYYPEPIALVDDTLVNHYINCFEVCVEDSGSYIQRINFLLTEYKIGENTNDLRTEILKDLHIRT
jgi:hypothetical protein